jgi:hypothetical protein
LLLFEGTFPYYFSKIKRQKESQNSRIQGFSLLFLHDDRRIRIGSIPLTSGSGSGRPKRGSGSGILVGTLWCYPFLENEGGGLVIGPQLEDMTQVQCSLLEMPVGLQDLAQLNRLSKI